MLRIFETDPDAQPKQVSDTVGRFRSGMQDNGRPVALQAWRLTTGDPDVADAIANLYGGEPQEWQTESGEDLEVLTDATTIPVLLDGSSAIRTSMVLWGRNGLIRSCDGVTQKGTGGDDPSSGQDCMCPASFKERKEAAKRGTGCEPSIQAYFRLADAPELGGFKFYSGSWSLSRDIVKVEESLQGKEGLIPATIGLEVVTMKNGNSFTKPVVKLK